MPRNGSGVASKPAGTTAVANTVIESAKYNSTIDDIYQLLNDPLPVVAGGTGATTVGGARQNLTTFTTKTSGYTAAASDSGAIHRCTSALTVALTAASSLASNWSLTIIADGADIIIDPNASETIDGRTTLTVRNGSAVTIYCDGSNFRTDLAADQRVPRGHLNGLALSNNATDATNDIDIATGEAASDGTIPYLMVLGTALTKRLDAAWAVGSGNGGLDSGSIANVTYHVWLIQRSDTGVVDALFSQSATSPVMPTNYDRKRRIGSIVRDSGAIVGFTQFGKFFRWTTKRLAYSSTATLTPTLRSMLVPTGIQTKAFLRVRIVSTASNAFVVTGNDDFECRVDGIFYSTFEVEAFTNTSAQITVEGVGTPSGSNAWEIYSKGWEDYTL